MAGSTSKQFHKNPFVTNHVFLSLSDKQLNEDESEYFTFDCEVTNKFLACLCNFFCERYDPLWMTKSKSLVNNLFIIGTLLTLLFLIIFSCPVIVHVFFDESFKYLYY